MDEAGRLFRQGGLQAGNHDLLHIEADLVLHGLVHLGLAVLGHGIGITHVPETLGDELVVLGAEDDGVHLYRLVGFAVVFDGELALGIGPEIGHQFQLVMADIGQDFQQFVAQVQRQGHKVLRVAAGIAEHHALVAGALLLSVPALHAAVDVRALLVDGA